MHSGRRHSGLRNACRDCLKWVLISGRKAEQFLSIRWFYHFAQHCIYMSASKLGFRPISDSPSPMSDWTRILIKDAISPKPRNRFEFFASGCIGTMRVRAKRKSGLSKRDGITFLPYKPLLFLLNHIQLLSAYWLVCSSRLALEILIVPGSSSTVMYHFILAIHGRYGISRNGTRASVMLKELKDSAQPKAFLRNFQ